MMPSSTFIFTSTPYAKSAVPLASLVPDKRYPHMDALSKIEVKEGDDYSVTIDKNFNGRVHIESDSFFKATITRIFSVEWEKETTDTFHVTAEEGRVYALRQPKAIFKKLCALEDVRKWLEEGFVDKQKTYLVIGYRTLLDAKLVRQTERSTNIAAQGRAPIGAPAEVDPTPTSEMDTQAAGGHRNRAGGAGEFETNGERIYAICYRKVGFKFFEGIDIAFLESGNRWKSFSKTRGKTQGEVEGEVVEADIEEEDEGGVGQIELFATTDGEERFVFLCPNEDDDGKDGDGDEGEEDEWESSTIGKITYPLR